MSFHETIMGRKFFEQSIPSIIEHLGKIGEELEKINDSNGISSLVDSDFSENLSELLFEDLTELMYENTILFSTLCKLLPQNSWKTRIDNNNKDFPPNSFIAGITTPRGTYSCLLHMQEWNYFDNVQEISNFNLENMYDPDNIYDKLNSLLEDVENVGL